MIPCEECLERMKPDDPRVKTRLYDGRLGNSICNGCNKPLYYREIEKPHELPEQKEFVMNQWNKVRQLQAEIEYYRRERADLLLKVNHRSLDKKKKYIDYV